MSYIYYRVEAVRIIDGDTIVLNIDLGNHLHWKRDFRLLGIDTPDRGEAGFAEATEHLKQLVADGISRVQTYKPDKFGRWLALLWNRTGEVNWRMMEDGFAKKYDGGPRE